jgi:glutamate:GABA antiporter
MNWRDLMLFYVVTSLNLQWVQKAAIAGPSAVVIWVGACLMFYVPLCFAVLELSSRCPNQGGIYVWTRQSFGRFSGFLTAWCYWCCNIPYYPLLLYFVAGLIPFILGPHAQHLAGDPRYTITISLVGLTLCVGLNIVGLNIGKWLHNIGAIGMWVPATILLVVAAISWHRFGSATAFAAPRFVPSLHLRDMIFWSTVAFAYAGVENASIMGEELDNDPRTVPRGLLGAGVSITILFIAATVAVLIALPMGEVSDLQGVPQAIQRAAERVGASWIVPIAVGFLIVGTLGQIGGWFAASARLPYAAAVEGELPPMFGRLHPTWRTPHIAMLIQAGVAVIWTLIGQAGATVKSAYDLFLAGSVIVYFIPYLYLFATLMRVQREPVAPGTRRVPGGKPVAVFCGALGFTTTAVSLVLAAVPPADEKNPSLYLEKLVGFSGLVVLAGAAIYGLSVLRRVTQRPQHLGVERR